MKLWYRFFLGSLVAALVASTGFAQQQPVISVDIISINIGGGPTLPANEQSGPAGTTIKIRALATGTYLVGSYTYSFFVNGISIGKSPAPVPPPTPDFALWTPPQPGAYFLTVIATDGTNTATSLPVRYFATGTVVNSPVTGTLVPQGSSISLKADATVGGGFVKQIQFYDNGVAIGSPDMTYPYSLLYTVPGAVGSTHNITAQATDNTDVLVAMSPAITMTVVSPILPLPTCTITNPGNNANIGIPSNPSSNISIAVNANSPGFITKVELYIDGVLFGTKTTFPYNFDWHPAVVGTYRLVALAYDDKNNVIASTTSTTASVTPAPTTVNIVPPPVVAIVTPTAGGTLPGGTPTKLSATASAANAPGATTPNSIVNVDFFVDTVFVGQASQPDAGTSNTYTVTATLTQKIDKDSGLPVPSVITAVASDAAGVTGVSPGVSVSVTVGGSGGGTVIGQPPTVSVTAPTAGTQFSVNTPVMLSADAQDPDGNIVSVQFFVNKQSVGTVTKYPYSTTWTPTSLGSYAITAKAIDNDGNAVTSNAVQVTVVDPSPNKPTVSITSPADGATVNVGTTQTITANASDALGIASVQFFVNGQPLGAAVTAFPFATSWKPTSAGSYTLTARAINSSGNQSTSSPVVVTVPAVTPPTVTLTVPIAGATYPVGNPVAISADASAKTTGATIAKVEFFANGVSLSSKITFPYTFTWTPTAAGTYSLTAVATDNLGGQATSAPVSVTIGINAAPIVTLTSPAAAGMSTSIGTIVTLSATAGDADGTITAVDFFVNGVKVGSATAVPYNITWTPTVAGTYRVVAQATDNSGNITLSSSATITVSTNVAPVVSLTAPVSGSAVQVSNAVMLTATASDSDGTIKSVEFFANGLSLGSKTSVPYSTTWTPAAEGTYQLTAMATDNSGAATTSSSVVVLVVSAGLSSTDIVYAGTYQGVAESGSFALVNLHGKSATFVGYATSQPAKLYFYQGIVVDGAGGFSLYDAAGNALIRGSVSTTGVSGTLGSGAFPLTFIGPNTAYTGTSPVTAGYYAGDISGNYASSVAGIVGSDGSIMVYVTDGAFQDAGSSKVAKDGSFTITTAATRSRLTGKIDPATGFLTGTISGGTSGSIVAALGSGVSFSDGVLKSLSTRGQVGSGANVLIAGFVVNGTKTKQMLIRAVGPSLVGFGISSPLSDPLLQLYRGNAVIAANDNWGGDAYLAATQSTAGAFTLPANSRDSVLVANLTPGVYTAQVSGVGNATGVALVELYDLDTVDPFTSQKLTSVSTRGLVGAGDKTLIAGFIVSGNTSKKVLVRGVGPSLATLGVANALPDPILVIRNATAIVRENDNWESGNDATLVTEAAVKVSAFPLSSGSKDAAILMTLPPGLYTAEVRSATSATGVALVETYEVP